MTRLRKLQQKEKSLGPWGYQNDFHTSLDLSNFNLLQFDRNKLPFCLSYFSCYWSVLNEYLQKKWMQLTLKKRRVSPSQIFSGERRESTGKVQVFSFVSFMWHEFWICLSSFHSFTHLWQWFLFFDFLFNLFKDWRQEEKETTEDEMVRWHHGLNGLEFE